jgi:hypothetical protein
MNMKSRERDKFPHYAHIFNKIYLLLNNLPAFLLRYFGVFPKPAHNVSLEI